jgi:hypothetical protein
LPHHNPGPGINALGYQDSATVNERLCGTGDDGAAINGTIE